jgi:FkbM family methyltransferase
MNPIQLVRRVYEGCSWRVRLAIRNASRKRYLRRTFENGEELVRSYVADAACDQAICRDGLVIRHPPGRVALARMILEVWFDEVYTRGFYSPQADDTVIDAGANIGLFSLWIARRSSQCRVMAFEPFDENFSYLQENIRAAGLKNVEAIRAGLSGESGLASMVDGGRRSQDHRLAPARGDAMQHAAVRTLSFADALAIAGSGRIALFKCDIEGSEGDLFERASADDLARVVSYAIEYHDNIRPGTLAQLQRRLRLTHDLTTIPQGNCGYGMLYARSKGVTSPPT